MRLEAIASKSEAIAISISLSVSLSVLFLHEEKIKSCEQLLDVVAAGARARATAATGVHAHSSRSHALLVISLEHRWRDVGETDPTKYNTQVPQRNQRSQPGFGVLGLGSDISCHNSIL